MTNARPAIIGPDGTLTYDELDAAGERVASALLDGRDDLDEARVAFFVSPGCGYAVVQRGVWRAGGIAVPLATSHPPAEIEYVLRDAGAAIVIADSGGESMLRPLAAATGARFI